MRRILSGQTENGAAAKEAALKDRLIGSSDWEYNGATYDLIDTAHYQYSGARGSVLSLNDDLYSYSYFDNSNAFISGPIDFYAFVRYRLRNNNQQCRNGILENG